MSLTGFGILTVEGLFGAGWVFLLPRVLGDLHVSMSVLATAYSVVTNLLRAVAIVLIALAVVTDRGRSSRVP